MITLHHGGGSGASLRLLIALEELALPYETFPVDLRSRRNWEPVHRRLAPMGEVPVLVDAGGPMTDSAIALLYLAEACPAPALLPSDAAGRYSAQAMIDTLDAALLPSVDLLGWHATTSSDERQAHTDALEHIADRSKPAGWSAVWGDAESDRLARAAEKMADGVGLIERALERNPWLVGDTYTVADISAFALSRCLPQLAQGRDVVASAPKFASWLARIAERPAVSRAIGRADGMPSYAPPR